MLHLGPRLERILDEVKPPCLWDLGADHGHLGLAAVERERVARAVLVDKSRAAVGALEARLDELASRSEEARRRRAQIRVVCADAALLPAAPLAGTVVLAGLGARTIVRVVERFVLPNVAGPLRLVLQPEVEAARVDALGLPLTRVDVEERGRRHVILFGDLRPPQAAT